MWPHLHGLVDEPPAPATLHALKTVAKPLMNMAFGVEYKDTSDSNFRFFKSFSVDNAGLMHDYLKVCSVSGLAEVD